MKYYEPYTEFRTHPSKVSLKNSKGKEIYIEIGPGISFGAGHHTTRLCIRGFEEIFKFRRIGTVLDLGCGSGVLGISAAALGAERVLAVDIDPVAVEEAIENVNSNGMGSIVQVLHGSSEDAQGRFDLVVANIVTNELILLREKIKAKVEEDGVLLVSGIYEYKKELAVSKFGEIGFSLAGEFSDGGWIALWFNKKPSSKVLSDVR
ncbi:MAG TPA: 50S ribosomal protein L11 methyltransferase [Thermodesulfobacteriota bacterium]|nr:50S ribosomal protein L11 methyltransferase [Thermodesulfobacteriota bacterium]